jgi:heme oxygenase
MSFLAKLKSETTECHVSLEKSLDLLRRVETKDAYRTLLARFLTIYEPLEKNLAEAVEWSRMGWEFSKRLKTPWLQDDLLALELSAAQIDALPRCEQLPPCDSFGAVVGCLYVIEGSTLGGQMLAQQFHQMLGITPENGGRFFQGYGEATIVQWREFRTWAEAQAVADSSVEEPAILAARATFEAFSRWLS